MTNMNFMLLGVLLLICILGGLAASPLPAIPRVQGGGRAEQGQAYSLTCVVEGLPGAETISFYVWYRDRDIIREETRQVLRFPRLTPADAGTYQCQLMLADGPLLSKPLQLNVKDNKKIETDSSQQSSLGVLVAVLVTVPIVGFALYRFCYFRRKGY